jgi:hypothetical protein
MLAAAATAAAAAAIATTTAAADPLATTAEAASAARCYPRLHFRCCHPLLGHHCGIVVVMLCCHWLFLPSPEKASVGELSTDYIGLVESPFQHTCL